MGVYGALRSERETFHHFQPPGADLLTGSEGQDHFGPAEIRGSHALRPVGARCNTDRCSACSVPSDAA